jgi:hypothetical protein
MHPRARSVALGVALCVFLFGLLAAFVRPSTGQEAGRLEPDQAVLIPAKLFAADGAPVPEYEWPAMPAARPFSHLLIRREASVPTGSTLTLFVRASIDGTVWTRWEEIIANDDLSVPEDGPDVLWSQVVDVGAVARFYQVRAVAVAAPDGTVPDVRRVEVNTVDATSGPEVPPPAPGPLAFEKSTGKPQVISRTAWGSPDGQGSRVAADYVNTTHIVVHHTTDPNPLVPGEVNWPARVRAIWTYHAITRKWGDIGYNYIIDPFGRIYEGRTGGDNAVGFHDTGNRGSMGVAMLGTFQSVRPSDATLDALVRLMAWKADQQHIDPLGRSYYQGCERSSYCRPYNAGSVVPNIAGHRQVTPGHTTCPGDATMAVMPELRERVRQLIQGGTAPPPPDDGNLEVDEREAGFAYSPATWYDALCGVGGHAYYTYATNDPSQSTNSATWRPSIPERGRYRVYAHVPAGCNLGTPTAAALYRIRAADGDHQRMISQADTTGWVNLGAYSFDAGSSGAVELYDLTNEPLSAGRVMYFDAVKWVKEDTAASIALVNVSYERTRLLVGELFKVTFTVENTGSSTLYGQAPQADTAGDLGTPDGVHAYEQNSCFLGVPQGSGPSFPKEAGRIRLVLGVPGWDAANPGACAEPTSDYPWRWGLNAPLEPGQRQTIVGYVRLHNPGQFTVRAGVVQEYVQYYEQGVAPATVLVELDERTLVHRIFLPLAER